MKSFLKTAFVNIFIVLILFSISEICIRIFYPEVNFPGTQKSLLKDSVYYDSPGLVPNSQGLSNGITKYVDDRGFWKYSAHKNNAKKKLLFLGDSVTMGIGVDSDSTFAGLINISHSEIEILNPSLIGYSSRDYLNIIKKILVENKNQLNISSVFIFWCLNDVYSSNRPLEDADGNLPDVSSSLITFFRNNFTLYHFLKNIFTDRPKTYYLFDKNFYNEENKYFKKAASDIVSIKNITCELNLDLHLILLPYEYQLRISDQIPQITLTKVLSENKINTHNFKSGLVSKNSKLSNLYLYGDGIHFSKLAHKMIYSIFKEKFNI